jgi:predicted RecA/RadA family phage recombinase
MAANYKAIGSTIEWTNGGTAVSSGDVVIVGDLVGIAAVDIANGATGTVHIEGVFEVACNASDTITQGMLLDWDASAGEFVDAIGTAASGDNENGVVAVEDDGGSTVLVKLLPGNGSTT